MPVHELCLGFSSSNFNLNYMGKSFETAREKTWSFSNSPCLLSSITSPISSFCLNPKVSFIGISKVKLEKLSSIEIDFYIEQFQPYDKAGAYAIQEWIGLCKISKIKGTYSNIMGLPVELVYRHLQAF